MAPNSFYPDEKSRAPEVKTNETFNLWSDMQNARVTKNKSVNNVFKQHHVMLYRQNSRHNLLVMINDLHPLYTIHLYIHALIYAAAITIKPWLKLARAGFYAHRDDEYERKRGRIIIKTSTISAFVELECTQKSLIDVADSI